MAARNTSGDAGKVNSHTRYKLTLAELEAFNSAVDNRLPYPWCVKPAGTADNVTTIIMGSGTAHTARPEVSVFPGQLSNCLERKNYGAT